MIHLGNDNFELESKEVQRTTLYSLLLQVLAPIQFSASRSEPLNYLDFIFELIL